MFARYLVLPSFLLELALAVNNSSSPAPDSTSTSMLTSFVTLTALPSNSTSSTTNSGGLTDASSCNQAKLDWVDNRGQTFVSNSLYQYSTSYVATSIVSSGFVETSGNTEVFTLCDGFPRVTASTEFKITVTTSVETSYTTYKTTSEAYRNVSAPACTIAPSACSALESQYNSSRTAYSSYASQSSSDFTGQTTLASVPYPTPPICGSPTLKLTATLAPAACVYNHATIQLLYWPVSTVGNHICGHDWTTVEATPTIEGQPNTAVGFNTTFTSPTVYMVMSGAYEVGSNYATGRAINGILPMASDAVSSMCAYQGGGFGPPEPMDYAEFDAPIPKDKYRCQPACWIKPDYPQSYTNSAYNITATENLCSTIYDGVYRPPLQVPIEQFNSFYANFTNGVGIDFDGHQCSFSPATDGIFYDPPSALQQVQSAVRPTAPSSPGATTTAKEDPQTTPAAPGNTVATALPQTTGGGDRTPQTTQLSASEPSSDDEGDGSSDPKTSLNLSNGSSGNNGGANDGGDNESNDGGSAGGSNGGGNGGSSDNGANDGSGSDAPTEVGGVIASIIGADPAPQETPSGQGPTNANSHTFNDSTNDGSAPVPSESDSQQGQSDSHQGQAGSQGQVGSEDQDGSQGSQEQCGSQDQSSSQDHSDSQDEAGSSESKEQPILLTDNASATVTATRATGGAIVLPSATLSPGQETSIAGIGAISVGSEGVAQNGQQIASAPSAADGYVVNGQTYTADTSSNIVVAPGVTLTAGGSAATVSGTTYSLSSGSEASRSGALVVDGVTATRTAVGAGSGSVSSGVSQQTGNAAPKGSTAPWGVVVAFCGLLTAFL